MNATDAPPTGNSRPADRDGDPDAGDTSAGDTARVWHRDNQRHLALAAAAVTARLDARPSDSDEPARAASLLAEEVLRTTGHPVALDEVTMLFGLTGFERDLLTGAAAGEIGLPAATGPVTFARALASLPDPHWSALLPDAPLRGWRLLDLPDQLPGAEPGGLSQAPLSVDERVLHALLGARTVDERLSGRAEIGVPTCALPPTHLRSADALAALCTPGAALEPVLLVGQDRLTRRQVVLTAGTVLDLETLVVTADTLPEHPAQADGLARLLARESGLGRRVLLLESADAAPAAAFAGRAALVGVPVVVSVDDPLEATALRGRLPEVLLDPCPPEDRADLLSRALARHGVVADAGALTRLAETHALTPARTELAAERACRMLPGDVVTELARACRTLCAQPLHGLGTVHESTAGLENLVLPDAPMRALRALVATVRQRTLVHDEWGYGERRRGLAVTALFSGPSGTGKTTAAEAVARELGRDLVSVDLSQVVSKYIGETEKNLAALFEAAESGAVLVFDEGDALFGRRTAVRDSHDRYANLEVSYLLQRLETFNGIAIVTTNAREAIDAAFVRRMRFVVSFPFPDAAQRAELWRAAFPARVPTEGLSPARLAQLAVSGGTITQLALHASFLAADEGAPVGMRHVLDAARIECDKLDRPLAASEVKGWV